MSNDTDFLRALRQILTDRFDESELRTLCFDLGINYDHLTGSGAVDKARELVRYLNRRGQLKHLLELGWKYRPDIDWPTISDRAVTIHRRRRKYQLAVTIIAVAVFLLGTGVWIENNSTLFVPLKYPREVVKDDFSTKRYHWQNGTFPFSDGSVITRGVSVDGTYFWRGVSIGGGGFFESADLGLILKDFSVSVDVRRIDGEIETAYGVGFRGGFDGVYRFEVRDTGEYQIVYQDTKNHDEFRLRPWTSTNLLKYGDFNTLSVTSNGDKFRLFINHILVDEVSDDRLKEGNITIFPTVLPNKRSGFEFDDFEVRVPS